MNDEKTIQLSALRDALKRNGAGMKFSDVENFMADFIQLSELRKEFLDKDQTFPKAVWYCLCNGNADRRVLVSKLYTYFTKHGKGHANALELVKYALYLGGIDSQLTGISLPSQNFQQSRTGSGGGNAQGNKVGGDHKIQVRKPRSKSGNKYLWLLGLVLVLAVVLFFIFKGSGKNTVTPGAPSYVPTVSDLVCRKYEGKIVQKEYTKLCIMVIRNSGGNALKVSLINKKNQSIQDDYNGVIKGDKLELDNGIDLAVKEHNNGKISLISKEDKKLGKWEFYSKD